MSKKKVKSVVGTGRRRSRTGGGPVRNPDSDKKRSGVAVDKGETVDKLCEIVSCEHVLMTGNPIVGTEVPHVMLNKPSGALFIAVEEGKVKILCSSCATVALQTTIPYEA